MIEEIVVTAQKREESLQDVPIAITAFSADQLDAKGVTDASRLQSVTPGLVFDSTANFSVIFLRGVGTDAFLPSVDLSVATYIDGVYFPYSFNLARSFGSLERIEVVKGPQGTLFGRNATGGAISIITKQPKDAFEVSAQQAFSRFDESRSKAYVTGPLTDTLSASLSGVYNEKSDYYKVRDPSPLDHQLQTYRDVGGDLKLHWFPADGFDATLTALALTTYGPSTSVFVMEKPSPVLGPALGLAAPDRDYHYSGDSPAASFSALQAFSATLNLRMSPFDVKSISAYQELGGNDIVDFDGTEKPVVDFRGGDKVGDDLDATPSPLRARVFTQELQFLSSDTTWGSGDLDWVGGLFYIKSTAGFKSVSVAFGGLNDLFALDSLGFLGSSPVLDTLGDLLGGLNPPEAGATFRLTGLLDTESYAGFAQATYHPIEWLGLTVGGRYQKEERTLYDASTRIQISPQSLGLEPSVREFDDRTRREDPFTPKFTVDAKVADDTLIYASWQRGHKSGSFNLVNLVSEPSEIKDETVTATEIGAKADFFGRRLRVNGAVFQNRIDNLQVQFVSLLSGATVNYENAGRATIRGADGQATWSILDWLVLDTSLSYLHGVYKEYVNASGYDPRTGIYSNNNDFSGNHIVRNPKWSGNATLNALFDVPGGELEASFDGYFNSGYYFDAQNVSKQNAYQLLGAQLSYHLQSPDIRVTLFGENLTGEKYSIFKFPVDFGTVSKLQPPASYGVRLSWEFE